MPTSTGSTEAMSTVYVMLTMDCESAKVDVSDHGTAMSGSGPAEYNESERSIRGYVEAAAAAGFPVTLFVHPEVAVAHVDLLHDLRSSGTCLGLHLHPYKFAGDRYEHDLGAYTGDDQRSILSEAIAVWENALGFRPLYLRAGYFSANDSTVGVLQSLGFKGGSLSNPGRILPDHASVWSGAHPYPHRAHDAFRLLAGDSDFIEVPVSVAFSRPVKRGHAGEQGFEWPYIPHTYDHAEVIGDILDRFRKDKPAFGTIVTDTHNDQDYTDPDHTSRRNLDTILNAIVTGCDVRKLTPTGITIDRLCDLVRVGS